MVGFYAKVVYEANRQPEWLNSVVVGMCVGLGACFGSVMGIASVFIYRDRIDSLDKKLKALFSLLLAVPVFFLGLFVIWRALMNLIELFPPH
jgi:ABC-type dipeptide/oligopeptide/nickel transport system permease component